MMKDSWIYSFIISKKKLLIYLFFGVLTTVVNFIIYTVCRLLLVNYIFSNVISWFGAVIFAYFTNSIYVFNSNYSSVLLRLKEFFNFISFRILSLIIEIILLYIFVDFFKINDFISKIAISVVIVILNYFASKIFVFKK